ncbi:MAG: DNA-directed RNA polymerase subunit B'' [Candidatus Pacearchaeota archaeon]
MKNDHIIVNNYLKNQSIVQSNITSFNNFIEYRLPKIVEEINESIQADEEFQVKLGKINVEKPRIVEADGSSSLLTPNEARMRNITYSAPITLELTVKRGEQIDTETVEIGKMPIMVKSNACNTADMSREELIKNNDDPKDPGGYFIVKGTERVMTMAEDLAENQFVIEPNKEGTLLLKIFSLKGTYRIPITLNENKEGLFNVTFSRFRDIPAVVLLKALGMTKESDIAKYIGIENDSVLVNLYEFTDLATQEDALMHIAKQSNIQGEDKEVMDRVKSRIDSYFLPHMGQSEGNREKKAITLCKMMKQYFMAKENPELQTDKDHYANKRVRLSGDLLASLFRVNLGILVRDVQYSLQKSVKRKNQFSIKVLAKSTLFSHRIESAIATGVWTGERSGITQNMDKTNYLAIISQLQKVSSMLPSDQENFRARTLHPTHYGRFCPIETPEGPEIGLRKNLALMSRISTMTQKTEEEIVNDLKEEGLQQESEEGNDVIMNGKFIGTVDDYQQFTEKVKEKRREGELPEELSVRSDDGFKNVVISTEPGRVMRPVIVVENGQPKITDNHLVQIQQGELNWQDLLDKKFIEYLDASEEENTLVAMYQEELTPEHTHLEIDPSSVFGTVTSLVPYGNHNQSSRLNRGSKTKKQSLGLYAANYHSRLDTDVSVMEYPQKPIVKSFIEDSLDIYPAGQNLIVAVMGYEGYNMEDALVFNKGSIDRGVGRSFYYRPYSAVEMQYQGGLQDEIQIPDKDTVGYRSEELYEHLESDGMVSPESEVNERDVLIGKVSPPKFLSEARDISIKTKKESSVTVRQEEKGVVDNVFITEDNEGNRIVRAKTRDYSIPEIGDKYSTTHGQKGIIGTIIPEEDVPFTATGTRPDVLFNPHGIPSRMTMGYLLELLSGKVGSLSGEVVDGTPFSGSTKDQLEDQLRDLGFRFDGKESMYHGITGKKMDSKIFVGNLHYLKLKYMVKNKMHGRASGKVALLTRQPIEGRARGGALRLGEMEQQALVAHGASLLLKERYDSDKTTLPICTRCGSVAVENKMKKKTSCPRCGGEEVEPIEVSYAFKLLTEELQGLHINTTFDLKNKYE